MQTVARMLLALVLLPPLLLGGSTTLGVENPDHSGWCSCRASSAFFFGCSTSGPCPCTCYCRWMIDCHCSCDDFELENPGG